jgi:hypothetical protein
MTWTNVPKPSESSVIGFSGGEPIGLLIALTQTVLVSSITTGWTDVTKPTSSLWSVVAKPTSTSWSKVSKPTT